MSSPLSPKLDWKLANAKWAASLNPLLNSPLSQTSILKNIPLKSGVTVINHLLGRVQQGWFLVDVVPEASAPVLTFYANAAVGGTVPFPGPSNVNFGAAVDDTGNGWNGSDTYTIPQDGYYLISGDLQMMNPASATAGTLTLTLEKNSSAYYTWKTSCVVGGSNVVAADFSLAVLLSKGDTISLGAGQSVDASPQTIVNGSISITNVPASGIAIYRAAAFNDKTLSLFSTVPVTVSIGVF